MKIRRIISYHHITRVQWMNPWPSLWHQDTFWTCVELARNQYAIEDVENWTGLRECLFELSDNMCPNLKRQKPIAWKRMRLHGPLIWQCVFASERAQSQKVQGHESWVMNHGPWVMSHERWIMTESWIKQIYHVIDEHGESSESWVINHESWVNLVVASWCASQASLMSVSRWRSSICSGPSPWLLLSSHPKLQMLGHLVLGCEPPPAPMQSIRSVNSRWYTCYCMMDDSDSGFMTITITQK